MIGAAVGQSPAIVLQSTSGNCIEESCLVMLDHEGLMMAVDSMFLFFRDMNSGKNIVMVGINPDIACYFTLADLAMSSQTPSSTKVEKTSTHSVVAYTNHALPQQDAPGCLP